MAKLQSNDHILKFDRMQKFTIENCIPFFFLFMQNVMNFTCLAKFAKSFE